MDTIIVNGQAVVIRGKLFRIAKVRDEPYDCLRVPADCLMRIKCAGVAADLFTFMQGIADPGQRYDYHMETDRLAILRLSTYENWWRKQINDKTRNLVRKAAKVGVEIKLVQFTDPLVEEIMEIYNESPLIQGKVNWHYGKGFDLMKQTLQTFEGRSEFLEARYKAELIGFVKLVRGDGFMSLMHILTKQAHRDKVPANALVAKAVEVCASQGVPNLHYGIWSRRGLGLFKKNNAFACLEVSRYFVPLNLKGKLILKCGLHRKLTDYLPDTWVDRLADLRCKWNTFRFRRRRPFFTPAPGNPASCAPQPPTGPAVDRAQLGAPAPRV